MQNSWDSSSFLYILISWWLRSKVPLSKVKPPEHSCLSVRKQALLRAAFHKLFPMDNFLTVSCSENLSQLTSCFMRISICLSVAFELFMRITASFVNRLKCWLYVNQDATMTWMVTNLSAFYSSYERLEKLCSQQHYYFLYLLLTCLSQSNLKIPKKKKRGHTARLWWID